MSYDGCYDYQDGNVTFHDDFPNDMVSEITIKIDEPMKRKELTRAVMRGLCENDFHAEITLSFGADFDKKSRISRFWRGVKMAFSELLH